MSGSRCKNPLDIYEVLLHTCLSVPCEYYAEYLDKYNALKSTKIRGTGKLKIKYYGDYAIDSYLFLLLLLLLLFYHIKRWLFKSMAP